MTQRRRNHRVITDQFSEAYFGKRRYGHQVIVIGAIERFVDPITQTRRLKLRIIPDTEQDSLEKFLEDTVERDSLVMTDCHMGYNDIEWLGYLHETWNHSKGHFAGTNHIEQNWSAMKRYMRKLYGSVPTKEIQLILDEWMARHNQPELFQSPEIFLLGLL
jgi:transposase-like protein